MKLNKIQRYIYLKWIDERIEKIKQRQKEELESMERLKREVLKNGYF